MKNPGKILLLLLITVLFAGCEEQVAPGSMAIYATDSPFPIGLVRKATITLNKIEVRSSDQGGDNGFTTLFNDTITLNLIDLRNGVMEKLAELDLAAGTYDLVRLYVEYAGLELVNSDIFTVKVPGGSQTGIKVFIDPPIRVENGLTAELVLDFNLEKSFVLKGNPNTPAGIKGFNFKPVIRAINNSIAGRVEGMIKDPDKVAIPNTSLWVEQDSTVASTFSDSTGYYNIIGLPTGIYTLFATKENYDTVKSDIVIMEANRTTRDFVLTPL